MPYNWKVVKIYEENSKEKEKSLFIWRLEKNLHFLNKNYKYLPKIKFGGSLNEWFKQVIYE